MEGAEESIRVCTQRHGGWANLIETWNGQRVRPVVSARRTCRQQGLLEQSPEEGSLPGVCAQSSNKAMGEASGLEARQ